MFKFDAVESEVYKGFYTTPVFNILASKEGLLKDKFSGKEIVPVLNKHWGYLEIESIHLLVHRLMALTFLEVPDNYEDLVVDHLDGNKRNNVASNLEWVTRTENLVRAFKNGLRTDNKHVYCKDLRSGEERCFYSLNECARFLLVNGSYVSEYLNKKQIAPFKLYFVLRFADGEYPNIGPESIGLIRSGAPKEIAVEYVNENIFVLFGNYREASEYTGVYRTLISRYVNETPRKTRNNMRFWTKQELVEGTPVKDMRGKQAYPVKIPKRVPVPIKVTNLKKNEVTYHESTEAFAKLHGAKKNSIQKKMLAQNGRWKHYKIEYETNTDNLITKSDLSETVG